MKILFKQFSNINKINVIVILTFIVPLPLLLISSNNQYALGYTNNDLNLTKINLIQDQFNYKHIIGIAQNTGNKTVNHIIISANFLDSNNKSIGNFSKQSEITTLNPKEITPFDILIFDKKIYDKINDLTMDFKYNFTKYKPKNLAIVSSNSHLDTNGFYFINGQVLNTAHEYSNNTTITSITYNKNDELAGIWKAQTESYNIPPSTTASFSIPVTDKIQSFKISNYTLLAESDEFTKLK
ncbi:MAG: FxLYD domain-containing protein [Thermoproteota archaeon]|nr:FxLYD domain-containing protein [Thermoproteota archaeon]